MKLLSSPSRFAWLLLLLVSAARARADVDAEDLRRGLLTVYRDTSMVEVMRLEPTAGLTLKDGESPHPHLNADGGVYRWQGYVFVPRAGAYRFRAVLRGSLRVTLDGKDVFSAESREGAATKESGEVSLKDGVFRFEAAFTRLPGDARLELWWSSPFFRAEPLPFDFLGHLPKELPARLAEDAQIDHGRYLAEEHGCRACHAPTRDDSSEPHRGPGLGRVGERIYPGWLLRWLDNPQKVRPGSRMPRMFADDEETERYALAVYLTSRSGPLKPLPDPFDPGPIKESAARGKALFASVGCVVCHDSDEKPGRSADGTRTNYPLAELGSKTTSEQLAAYLLDPLAIDPSGRMPNMLLRTKEAEDLSQFLCRSKDAGSTGLPAAPAAESVVAAFAKFETREPEQARFRKLSSTEQVQELGRRLLVSRQCVNCHAIPDENGKPLVPGPAAVWTKRDRGCLDSDAARRGRAPWFGFDDKQRDALKAFLAGMKSESRSPLHSARTTLRRFNCLACHNRDGEGGLSPTLAEEMRKYEKAENAEAVLPPPLTGVGHKLRTSTLRDVLLDGSRARPWMGLRMPQFGPAAVGALPEALAHLEGAAPNEIIHQVKATPAILEAGRQLVGKTAFGCTSCHDIAGIPNTGTRGPDLALTNRRVRYEWWQRWLEQPQRMQPGTRMPTVFTEGKSLVPGVLGGHAEAQGEAMWAYLSQGPGLPLPDGLEPPPGLTLSVRNRPVLLRTFMPEAGTRAYAVGYPGGGAVAFDATTCRLAYAWSFDGDFLDTAPVWKDRGGNPARLLGTKFWTSPVGFPWAVAEGKEPPDFASRATDPAWGYAVPGMTLFKGDRRLSFEGHFLDEVGQPTFRYRTHPENGPTLEVREQAAPMSLTAGPGLRRRFTLHPSRPTTVWLLAGETKSEPRLLDENGAGIRADWKSGRVEETVRVPSDGGMALTRTRPRFLVLPQGDRVLVLDASGAPRDTVWDVRRRGDVWHALLRLSDVREDTFVRLDLWAPRDEGALLKELGR